MDSLTPINDSENAAGEKTKPPVTLVILPVAVGVFSAVAPLYFGGLSLLPILWALSAIVVGIVCALYVRKSALTHARAQADEARLFWRSSTHRPPQHYDFRTR